LHILLFNEYYAPDTSATAKMAAQVVAALARRHRVTVVAGRPSYDPDEYYPYRLLRRKVSGSIAIERVGSTAHSRHAMRGRIANYLSYLSLAVPRSIVLRADLVLAMTDPPFAGIAGAFIARATRRPFVYNVRDLYPDMVLGGGILRPSRGVDAWEAAHRWALRQAARVIVLGDDMRARILEKGIPPERVVVIRDGAPIPARLASPEEPAAQKIRGGFPFVAIHAGNLGFYGAWNTILEAARLLGDSAAIVFIGDGAHRASLQASARAIPQVRFLPFLPADQIPSVMAAGDVHIVTIRRGLEGVVVPSKVYSILAAGRPLLAVAPENTDVVRIVRQFGCGAVADPDDPASVVRAILELRADPVRLAEMGQLARNASQSFARDRELARFVEVVEEAAPSALIRPVSPELQNQPGRLAPAQRTGQEDGRA
jgi:colanic acid biosynthesis glycosyl transferase WcaI